MITTEIKKILNEWEFFGEEDDFTLSQDGHGYVTVSILRKGVSPSRVISVMGDVEDAPGLSITHSRWTEEAFVFVVKPDASHL